MFLRGAAGSRVFIVLVWPVASFWIFWEKALDMKRDDELN